MADYLRKTLHGHFHKCDNGTTNQIKGRAFEDLACYLFGLIPGIIITARNQMNTFHNEEIDVAIWNEKSDEGLFFLPHIILIECKNWNTPVSSIDVSWFANKLQRKGLDYGILIANKGITGNSIDLNAAHDVISFHMAQKRYIIVITRTEIEKLTKIEELVLLIKEKLCLLAVSGAIA